MHHRLRQCCTWAVAATLICSQLLQAQSVAKVAMLTLRDYGWEAPEPIHAHEVDTVGRRSIVIDHQGRVLVGFVVRERSGLVTRDRPALSFHVVRLTPDGKMDLSLSLPTNGWRTNSVYLSETQQIIARANDSLQLLQSDSASTYTGAGSWKIIASCASRCQVTQSPSGRTLLVDTWDADPPLRLIDTSQLPAVRSCEKSSYPAQSITDKFAYYAGWQPRQGYFSYRWPLCDFERRVEMAVRIVGRYTVVNDGSLVTNADVKADRDRNRNLQVISPDGQVKFRETMADHESWDNFWVPIRSSERGNRIAVDILTARGGNRTLDISSHITARRIAVYDIEAGKEVASIPASPKHRYRFEFDLSPDGHRLAILEDDTVKVVDLEEGTKPAEAVDPRDGGLHPQVPIPVSKPKQ
jgi:hypothetical protein